MHTSTVSSDLLKELGRLELSEEQWGHLSRRITAQRDRIDWCSLIRRSLFNKVSTIVMGRLSEIESVAGFWIPEHAMDPLWEVKGIQEKLHHLYLRSPANLSPVSRLEEALIAHNDVIEQALRGGILDALSSNEIPALLIKGGAMKCLYPASATRDLSDLDIVVPTVEAGWSAIRLLTSMGYAFQRIALEMVAPGTLIIEAEGTNANRVTLDLHLGGFHVACQSQLAAPLWNRAVMGEIAPGIQALLPSYEDRLIILLAHVVHHGYLLHRDINDIYLLLGRELDWDYVRQVASQNALSGVLRAVIQLAARAYSDISVPQDIASAGGVRTALALLMCKHAGESSASWSLPYVAAYLAEREREDAGWRATLDDIRGYSLRVIEEDLWLQSLEEHSSFVQKPLSLLRGLVPKVMVPAEWSVLRIPTWGVMKLERICWPIVADVAYDIEELDISSCANIGRQLGAQVRELGDIVAWRYPGKTNQNSSSCRSASTALSSTLVNSSANRHI